MQTPRYPRASFWCLCSQIESRRRLDYVKGLQIIGEHESTSKAVSVNQQRPDISRFTTVQIRGVSGSTAVKLRIRSSRRRILEFAQKSKVIEIFRYNNVSYPHGFLSDIFCEFDCVWTPQKHFQYNPYVSVKKKGCNGVSMNLFKRFWCFDCCCQTT